MVCFDFQGDSEQVELLVTHGADVNQPGHSGVAALHITAMCGHHEVDYLQRFVLLCFFKYFYC